MDNRPSKQVIFLKNKTVPVDKYEIASKKHNFDKIKFITLIKHRNRPTELVQLFTDNKYLNNLKYIIITSQRTVECLYLEVLPNLSESQRNILFNKVIYTVGPATSEFLKRCGFKTVLGEDSGNGNNLADMIMDQIPPPNIHGATANNNNEFLFLVGLVRTDIIKNKLTNKGYQIREIIAYETVALDNNLVKLKNEMKFDTNTWIVIFSPQGIKEIIPYLKQIILLDNLFNVKIASIGPTTEAFLLKHNIKPHVTSPKPTPESLLNAISSYE
ncbi:uroporphyrinogen-III synthase HEM4 PWA37_001657 [Arxiozyma heterogenica]|uniref:uroporphyrinogen-III synthase HEM4 n=1 Tax=Arxiozyma heterogenica TaxID=278026 RepID=UPI002F0FD3AF